MAGWVDDWEDGWMNDCIIHSLKATDAWIQEGIVAIV